MVSFLSRTSVWMFGLLFVLVAFSAKRSKEGGSFRSMGPALGIPVCGFAMFVLTPRHALGRKAGAV